MTKLKVSQVLEVAQGINDLLGEYEPDPVISRRLHKTQKSLKNDLESYDEARKKLLDAHSKKGEDGKNLPGEKPGTVKLKDPEAFSAEIKKLQDDETEVELTTVKLSRLPKCRGYIIALLDPIIEDDAQE